MHNGRDPADLPFTTYQDIYRRAADRPIVLFGAGNIAAKTARRLTRPHQYILDNNPSMWAAEELGTEIRNPSILEEILEPRPYFLICTTSFTEVSAQLNRHGFSAQTDYAVSPVLNDLRVISDMEQVKTRLLFTSGSPPLDDPRIGGGIYEMEVDGDFSYRKVYSGNCHGLIPFGDHFVAIDDSLGLFEFDSDVNILRNSELPANARGHGVVYAESTQCFYIVASHMDAVLIYDQELQPAGQISISGKHGRDGTAHHHCNDITCIGNSLYVSMFSKTGNWKNDIFDGAVIEIDIPSGSIIGAVAADLWMPHNVMTVNGGLVVLDSLRGHLLQNNLNIAGTFPGFTRGLCHDGMYFYIGQSRNRNYSKNIGTSNNISIDASIIIFDETTKVSRSLPLPNRLSEIHAIAVAT